jgi:hypothetical protein
MTSVDVREHMKRVITQEQADARLALADWAAN